jgi:purine-cytosine permease-like protein
MKQRVSIQSWTTFIAGYYVATAVFGIGFSAPSLIALVFPTVFQVFREDIIYSVEGLLLAALSHRHSLALDRAALSRRRDVVCRRMRGVDRCT